MAVAHLAVPGIAREELAQAEKRAAELRDELIEAQNQAAESRRAGAAVLGAVEAAMAPLMAELASVRRDCTDAGGGLNQATANDEQSIPGLMAEIDHLQVDIRHHQAKAARLAAEGRQRGHELGQLRSQLAETLDTLAYEQEHMRHVEAVRQLNPVGMGEGWPGLGPSGIGKRTLEVRGEKKLRESAEQRSKNLAKNVSKLASDTTVHQARIEQLGRQLEKVRQSVKEKDQALAGVSKLNADMHSKLLGVGAVAVQQRTAVHQAKGNEDEEEGEAGAGAAPQQAKGGGPHGTFPVSQGRRKQRLARNGGSSSTGKLPQLSF